VVISITNCYIRVYFTLHLRYLHIKFDGDIKENPFEFQP